jgi:hypothetical protein
MTRTLEQNNILHLDPLYGHMTKTPKQNNINVQINNGVHSVAIWPFFGPFLANVAIFESQFLEKKMNWL